MSGTTGAREADRPGGRRGSRAADRPGRPPEAPDRAGGGDSRPGRCELAAGPAIRRRLTEIRARAARATPGPWSVTRTNPWHATADRRHANHGGVPNPPPVIVTGRDRGSGEWAEQAMADIAFAAAAREDVPWLLQLVEAMLYRFPDVADEATGVSLEATGGPPDRPAPRGGTS